MTPGSRGRALGPLHSDAAAVDGTAVHVVVGVLGVVLAAELDKCERCAGVSYGSLTGFAVACRPRLLVARS